MTSNRKITVNQYEYMELHKNFEDGIAIANTLLDTTYKNHMRYNLLKEILNGLLPWNELIISSKEVQRVEGLITIANFRLKTDFLSYQEDQRIDIKIAGLPYDNGIRMDSHTPSHVLRPLLLGLIEKHQERLAMYEEIGKFNNSIGYTSELEHYFFGTHTWRDFHDFNLRG